jgi:hypothetical protein
MPHDFAIAVDVEGTPLWERGIRNGHRVVVPVLGLGVTGVEANLQAPMPQSVRKQKKTLFASAVGAIFWTRWRATAIDLIQRFPPPLN